MAHWRDGGIGNMAGSDDRPIEEWTLLEKLAAMIESLPNDPDPDVVAARDLAQTIFDWIEPITAAARRGERLPLPVWQPIATALPLIPAYKPDTYNAKWPCLLQNERGDVSEGWAYWVPPRTTTRGTTEPLLRWATRLGQCTTPKYWMPLPAPKVAP